MYHCVAGEGVGDQRCGCTMAIRLTRMPHHCVQEEEGGDQRFGCTIAKYSIYEDTTSSLGSEGRKWDSRVWMHYSYWIAVFDFKENVWLYMGQLRARFVVVRRKLRSSNANCSNNQNESFSSF